MKEKVERERLKISGKEEIIYWEGKNVTQVEKLTLQRREEFFCCDRKKGVEGSGFGVESWGSSPLFTSFYLRSWRQGHLLREKKKVVGSEIWNSHCG